MAISRTKRLLNCLHCAAFMQKSCGMTDAVLLERFLAGNEETAFQALLRRHGPMVLGVCRRILCDAHDADDAFQATFLVLVRKASSILPRSQVGPWLYGVARRTALKVRSSAARRCRAEQEAARRRPKAASPGDTTGSLCTLIDEELGRLPQRYRDALVLCLLQGKSRREAAELLGWREGTLSGRLARAKELLSRRLRRRGVALSSSALGAYLAESAVAEVPAGLAFGTAKATAALGGSSAAKAVSAPVIALTEEVLKTMFTCKLKAIAGMIVLLTGVGFGAGAVAWQRSPAAHGSDQDQTATEEEPASQPPARKAADKELAYVIEPPDLLSVNYGTADDADPVKIAGDHLVRPDGTIGFGSLGSVFVAGRTLEGARVAIARHLAGRLDGFDRDKLTVAVVASNSKVFYVIVTKLDGTQEIYRFPATGHNTVLDALLQVNGQHKTLIGLSKKRLYVERISKDGQHIQVLPVDGKAIVQDGDTSSNFVLRPGDRVYIQERPVKETSEKSAASVNYLSRRTFRVPFVVDDTLRKSNDRLFLYCSDNHGRSYPIAQATPLESSFQVEVPGDGSYSFVVQSGRGYSTEPADVASAEPALKVCVDTTAPEVNIARARRAEGNLDFIWRVRDANLDLASVVLQWRAKGKEAWSPLSIPKEARGRHSFALPEEFPSGPVELRLQASDLAGNVGTAQVTLP
jgi:RNA polymerase sigma factor (sigma-70 family)